MYFKVTIQDKFLLKKIVKKYVKLRTCMSEIVATFEFNVVYNTKLIFEMNIAMKNFSILKKIGIIVLISAVLIYLILSFKFLLS